MLDKTNFYLNLGKNIKKIREEKKYSLDEFSKVSGLNLNKSTISAIENGKQQLSVYQLYLITGALDIDIVEILGDLDASNGNNKHLLNKSDINLLENL
ncbi:MAG: helix-turn-helix transcriptional regulator [Candidatus Falkowbacteria bacterium]|nr:helix-turn-helix transcriptional regulator [Candidatus Falkowbacteria bacterium]